MSRVRVSTTVDSDLLMQARHSCAGAADSVVVDAALRALIARHRADRIDLAYAAYDEFPLDEPDAWGDLQLFREAVARS